MKNLPEGVALVYSPDVKAYSIEYRSVYSASPVIYYGKSRGQVLSAWMKENNEYDYFECSAMLSIKRHPQSDIFRCVVTDTPKGKALQAAFDQLCASDKLSLLSFCGMPVRYIDRIVEHNLRSKTSTRNGMPAYDAALYYNLGDNVGWVRGSEEPGPLFDHSNTLTFTSLLTYFPHLSYRGITHDGQAMFMLALQDVMDKLSRKISASTWQMVEQKIQSGTDNAIEQCDREQPSFCHRMWESSPQGSMRELPCLIYSGQWGTYWRDTSGYSYSRDKCRVFALHDALAHTNHCGKEKWIRIALLSPSELTKRNAVPECA